jgi:hypothetical protein
LGTWTVVVVGHEGYDGDDDATTGPTTTRRRDDGTDGLATVVWLAGVGRLAIPAFSTAEQRSYVLCVGLATVVWLV